MVGEVEARAKCHSSRTFRVTIRRESPVRRSEVDGKKRYATRAGRGGSDDVNRRPSESRRPGGSTPRGSGGGHQANIARR